MGRSVGLALIYIISCLRVISSYNRAVILYQSCRDISLKYIVLEKDNIMPYIKNVEHEKVVRRCQKGQLSRIC